MKTKIMRRLIAAATISMTAWISMSSHAQQANINPKLLASDLPFTTIDGETFSLKQRWDSKPVLLYFWATWCPYCKKATPLVTGLHNHYGENIDVLGVNIAHNDSVENIREYMQNYGVNFPMMFDHSASFTEAFSVNGTPVFVVLSQEGELLYRGHRYPIGIESAFASDQLWIE